MVRWYFYLVLALSFFVLSTPITKAAYPEKPITMIVAYGAGGSTDVTARMLAPFIEKHLGDGARVDVINRPGAGGEIGFANIVDAAPDGYTIGFINTPNVITIPIERKARFALDRIDPLINLIDDPGAMTVHQDSLFKTVADLVRFAKAHPNKVTVGTTGLGSDDHLAMLLLQRQAKVQFVHAPFSSSAAIEKAVADRKIDVCDQNIGEALRARKAEPLRILGVMSATRWYEAADVPTFREQGFDITLTAMRGIAAPKGLPADARDRLVEAITKAAQDPEFMDMADLTYQPLRILPSAEYAEELKRLDAEFRVLWMESPWTWK